VALTECQITNRESSTVVKEETAHVSAINVLDVKFESDCVRTELPDGTSKVIILDRTVRNYNLVCRPLAHCCLFYVIL